MGETGRIAALVLTVWAALAAVPVAHAAQDGSPGATSTGTFSVGASVSGPSGPVVVVSGLIDFGLLGRPGDGHVRLPYPICLYHSSPTFSLAVEQVGRTSFAAVDSAQRTLDLEIQIADLTRAGTPVPLSFVAARTETGLRSTATSPGCADGVRQLMQVGVSYPFTAVPGVYSASMRIIMGVE